MSRQEVSAAILLAVALVVLLALAVSNVATSLGSEIGARRTEFVAERQARCLKLLGMARTPADTLAIYRDDPLGFCP